MLIDLPAEPQATENAETSEIQAFRSVASLIREDLNSPKVEFLKFNSDPMQYPKFIRTFETNVEGIVREPNRRLLLLIQYCEGEAKRMIEYCLLLDSNVGYKRAKETLERNYGRKNVIARAYIERLQKGAQIKLHDTNSLMQLARELEECNLTLKSLAFSADLNNFEFIATIIKRLPFSIQSRWLRFAAEIEGRGTDPKFVDLVKFVNQEAEVARSSFAHVVNQKPKRFDKFSSHSTAVKETPTEHSTTRIKCHICSENHMLEACSKLAMKNYTDKIAFLRQNRLCDNCFKEGHVARFCRSTKTCQVKDCSQRHHKMLHRDHKSDESTKQGQLSTIDAKTAATVRLTTTGLSCAIPSVRQNDLVYLNIVPVRVASNNKELSTYAFLDQGSTTALCSKKLLKELNATGDKIKYSLTTVSNSAKSCEGEKLALSVFPANEDVEIKLPCVYAVDKLPVVPNAAPTDEELCKWPHLRDVPLTRIPDGEVLLLIGVDVPELFWTLDERRGCQGQPYAIKTVLGWSMIGASAVNKSKKNCHVNFIRKSQELSNQEIECLWRMDQLETVSAVGGRAMSKEDRYALKTMQDSRIYDEGHHRIALPWRPGAPTLRDNFEQAATRLKPLQKRFEKNSALKEKYVATIQRYIDDGFARKLSEEEKDDQSQECWYLPHHAVINVHKPDKVRVVFDCAAYHNGSSLNQQLLPGPDFLNSLVGVLCRFRMNKIAIVADIEAMYHQIKVDPKDHKYLRFLWWPNGDTSVPIEKYCKQVHIFGAKSSPSCAIFALRQTAFDNANNFSDEAVESVKDNFYMDDLLKSVNCVTGAIQLAQELIELLSRGGFRLTKFLSNDPRVVKSLPAENRSVATLKVPDAGGQFCERVLGMMWDYEFDLFRFNINITPKSFTIRGILSMLSSLFDPLGFAAPVILKAKILLQELCRKRLGWDEKIDKADEQMWQTWLSQLSALEQIEIPRCVLPTETMRPMLLSAQLHHFADASSSGCGVVFYLRTVEIGKKRELSFCLREKSSSAYKDSIYPAA